MTIFVGAMMRDKTARPDVALADAVETAFRHMRGAKILLIREGPLVLAQADIGAFPEPGIVSDTAGRISILSGDPIVESGGQRDRAADLTVLHEALTGPEPSMPSTRGIFALTTADSRTARLILTADPLALRPIYWLATDEMVVFASRLTDIEAMPGLGLSPDLTAATQELLLGYPIGDTTPFTEIKSLRDGEQLILENGQIALRRWYDWTKTLSDPTGCEAAIDAMSETFAKAVSLRLNGADSAMTTLSGGLDSRVVAAAIARTGVKLTSLNFSIPGTEDHLLAGAFAERIGSTHIERPIDTINSESVEMRIRHALNDDKAVTVWSGNGGSVAVGHVYLSTAVADAMERGDINTAISIFIDERGAHLAGAALARPLENRLSRVVPDGIASELQALETLSDPVRAFHLFLMRNDQRRHLAPAFEALDRFRLEFHCPLYDTRFLEAVMRAPARASLGHGLYMDWLK
ncbi:MAG: asparagine synthase-related protein, partial [Pseudomonadota bacterium]|nr:asparagine synthase-related protein [Pseudomonadota bacterium]